MSHYAWVLTVKNTSWNKFAWQTICNISYLVELISLNKQYFIIHSTIPQLKTAHYHFKPSDFKKQPILPRNFVNAKKRFWILTVPFWYADELYEWTRPSLVLKVKRFFKSKDAQKCRSTDLSSLILILVDISLCILTIFMRPLWFYVKSIFDWFQKV